MRYKGLTIVIFTVVTFVFVFGFLNYSKKISAMLGKEIVQASTGDLVQSPAIDVEVPDEEPVEIPAEEPADEPEEHGEVIVPSLLGLTEAEAESLLEELKLIADPHDEYSEVYTEGSVFWQTPYQDIRVMPGAKISFSVSMGKREDTAAPDVNLIKVPNLIGMTKEAAESELRSIGFQVEYEYNPSEHYGEGFVYSQNYKVGATVNVGTAVKIRVSTGRP